MASFNIRTRGQSDSIRTLCKDIVDDLISANDEEPFAIAASPLQLTKLGVAANRSGFSPATCRAVIGYLRQSSRVKKTHDFLADLLLELGTAPEQTNTYLRKIILQERQKGFVKRSDLAQIICGWTEGEELYDLFVQLPTYKKSKASDESRAAEFDKFVQVVESALGNFLPWLLRACGSLDAFGADWAQSLEWSELATTLEKRVSLEDFDVAMEAT